MGLFHRLALLALSCSIISFSYAQTQEQLSELVRNHRQTLDCHHRSIALKNDIVSSLLDEGVQSLDIHVVPYGVTHSDCHQWPQDLPIPSNAVTVHLVGSSYQGMAVRATTSNWTIALEATIWKPSTNGQWLPEHFTLGLAPSFSINFGEEGTFVVSVVFKREEVGTEAGGSARDIKLAAGVQTFELKPFLPEESGHWWQQDSPCLDIPSSSGSTSPIDGGPPFNIPKDLCSEYGMNGAALVGRRYFDDT